ncbi:ABC transporter substrate-binding protein [Solirubrobacter soli]|uniref:ABC transporter substrate-binding protein n=1 Tax=Solirubrobacter soli TaxID=363832 RepID=UPI0012FBA34E|nr:ABC transporter substrate-binding protein [Solirubrobacter soli]
MRGKLAYGAATVALAAAVAACGSSSESSSTATPAKTASGSTATKEGGTVTVLMGTAPDFLDPQEGYTTQSAEATWISYLGLYTYAHKNGEDGGKVIPGVAQDFPTVSADGKTYTLTLRQGLSYSDGSPVKASDFTYTIQRALKLNWGGKSFFTGYIKGAEAYDTGKSHTISGIQTDDNTGKITITLTKPYGAFLNVLAFPAAGLVPTGTKMSNLSNTPPPGVGPYEIKNVVPNRSFDVVRNPKWTATMVPGVAPGHVDVTVKIASNTQTEAEQVLNNSADIFDWADQIPPSLISQVTSKAAGRYKQQNTISTFYFFLNTQAKPFNNQLAREAVNYALDRRALNRLNGGNFTQTCWFLPEGLVGHPTSACPYGDPNGAPDLNKAKALVQQSGMAGQPVTVWSETRSPRKEFAAYYTDVLNQIGFKAKTKVIADAQYFPTIGNKKTEPQTGFADWNQDFPNPSDFYLLMDAGSIQDTNNQNFSQVNDPHIQSELKTLNAVPADKLDSVANQWQQLDQYLAQKAYIAAYGQEKQPMFFSDRIDFPAAVFSPLYGNDWSSISLK